MIGSRTGAGNTRDETSQDHVKGHIMVLTKDSGAGGEGAPTGQSWEILSINKGNNCHGWKHTKYIYIHEVYNGTDTNWLPLEDARRSHLWFWKWIQLKQRNQTFNLSFLKELCRWRTSVDRGKFLIEVSQLRKNNDRISMASFCNP